jgi:thiol-disulfide isomerase/thioredoxin
VKSLKNRFWPIIAVVAVGGGLFVLFNAGGETPPAGKSRPPEPPVRPDVSAITLPTVDGGKFSTAAYKGKSPVLVSFFATWCEPCRQELPHLIALYKKYHAAGLQIAYITNEDKDTVLRFRKAMSIPFPILIDADSTVSHEFGADSIPLLVVLDKQGRAAGGIQGYSEDELENVDRLTGSLLKE